ncbi:hypothetical protein HHK36_000272 [Tetracentron sinense]|uniref:RHOMBOID-like protein n=1 Tax=Tetracentron sinense TaxID=13715 RepID=A0A835A0P6_TETSI|nr:hypothetical protein HHK36_000272 [Tetracentron sinense]
MRIDYRENKEGFKKSLEKQLRSWWKQWRSCCKQCIPIFSVANIVVFIVTMYINNCPENYLEFKETSCRAKFLGRLEKLGGFEWNKVVNMGEGWRLFTSNWLHGDVKHLLSNTSLLFFLEILLDFRFGFGLGCSILSALFNRQSLSYGSSGAVFGLIGAIASEIITNWTTYNKVFAVYALVNLLVILTIGSLPDCAYGSHPQDPEINNIGHIGGWLTGFLLGFVLLLRPQFRPVELENTPANFGVKFKYKVYQYILWLVALVLLIVGFTVGLVMLFRGVNGIELCHWCRCMIDCTTVTGLVSACSTFITYGSPDPIPGTPCCDALESLNNMADSIDNRRSMCRCIMGLITTYNPNATALATLPGFCGISLGFNINPNTDCNK